MKKNVVFLAFMAVAAGLAAKTLVLPLAVASQDHASHQWLGKAVSFFLITGLGHNGLPVSEEEEVQALLNRNLVRFPFDITKATAMVLAGESGAERLLWGKIVYGDAKSAEMQVQLFLIDIKEPRQRPLPLVKGSFADMFKLQEELLRYAVMALAPGQREIVQPRLNMSLPEYEKFIKSLLLSDAGKKLELLQTAPGTASRSDFVHFEMAKACLEKRDPAGCRSHLERVADAPFFKDRKEFLLALADYYGNDADAALNRFIRLQQANVFPVPTHNNLGVIYLARGNFSLAEKCLRYALYLRKDPGILANLVLLLQAMGRGGAAQQELTAALRSFPEDGRLLKLFAASVAAAENREALGQAFRNFVPLPLPGENVPAVEPHCHGSLRPRRRRPTPPPPTCRTSRRATFSWRTISRRPRRRPRKPWRATPSRPRTITCWPCSSCRSSSSPRPTSMPRAPSSWPRPWTTTCCSSRSSRPGWSGRNSARPWRWPCRSSRRAPSCSS